MLRVFAGRLGGGYYNTVLSMSIVSDVVWCVRVLCFEVW